MGNGMNKVVDGLYLGNIRDSENRESLSQNNITHILSVYNNAKPVLEDMTYLCIHAADVSSQNLSQHFKESIRFIHECRLNGGACLVHCLAGVSRSTTMVVAYLMTVTTYSWEECLSAVKAVRSFVGPNYGFQQQLQEYQMNQVTEPPTTPSNTCLPEAHDVMFNTCLPEAHDVMFNTCLPEAHDVMFNTCLPEAHDVMSNRCLPEAHDVMFNTCLPEAHDVMFNTCLPEAHDVMSNRCLPEAHDMLFRCLKCQPCLPTAQLRTTLINPTVLCGSLTQKSINCTILGWSYKDIHV
uniref:Dual specificity phosphatase 22a n=1 Tax=Oncorhynchus kisutch TaxID=8019 RepID=A0A8C7MJ39_ONCKI